MAILDAGSKKWNWSTYPEMISQNFMAIRLIVFKKMVGQSRVGNKEPEEEVEETKQIQSVGGT